MQSAAFVKRYKETIRPERLVGHVISGLACSYKNTSDREPQLCEWSNNRVKSCVLENIYPEVTHQTELSGGSRGQFQAVAIPYL